MTCTTCGRENPPHLTFCQECGQRLGPRIAPPTPPIGLTGGDGAGADVAPRVATRLGAVAPAAAFPSPPGAPPPATTAEKRCRVCDTVNGAGLRYCTSCGSTLEPAAAPVAATISDAPVGSPSPAFPAPPAPTPNPASLAPIAPVAAFAPAPPAPIAPMRVVDLGTGAPDGPRTCGRCRGAVDSAAQFCKFCGAPLGEALAPMLQHAGLEPRSANGKGSSPGPPPVEARRPATAPLPQTSPPPVPSASPIAPLAAVASAAAPALSPQVLAVPALSPLSASMSPSARGTGAQPIVVPADARVPSSPPAAARGLESGVVADGTRSARAPAVTSAPNAIHGRLVVIAKSGADGPSYPIGESLDIGRAEGQIVVGEDPYLSPRHVRIAWMDGKLVLRDLASTNGVFLRLAPARDMAGKGRADASSPAEVAVPLEDQDLILVGQQVLRFEVNTDGESGLGPAVEHGTLLFGSPASPRYARLGQRTVEGVTRDVYYVRKVETVLGRESGDVVFTEDPFLSRRHAAIRVLEPASGDDEARFALVDLGSSNGTFLRIRSEVELVAGDHFRVGQQLFRVDMDGRPSDNGGRAG